MCWVAALAWPYELLHERSFFGTGERERSALERMNFYARTAIGYMSSYIRRSRAIQQQNIKYLNPHHAPRFTWTISPEYSSILRFTRAYGLAPVDVVFSISRRVLDKDPLGHIVTLRTAQEIVHVWAPSAVAWL
jgi:hypothetical protein